MRPLGMQTSERPLQRRAFGGNGFPFLFPPNENLTGSRIYRRSGGANCWKSFIPFCFLPRKTPKINYSKFVCRCTGKRPEVNLFSKYSITTQAHDAALPGVLRFDCRMDDGHYGRNCPLYIYSCEISIFEKLTGHIVYLVKSYLP